MIFFYKLRVTPRIDFKINVNGIEFLNVLASVYLIFGK